MMRSAKPCMLSEPMCSIDLGSTFSARFRILCVKSRMIITSPSQYCLQNHRFGADIDRIPCVSRGYVHPRRILPTHDSRDGGSSGFTLYPRFDEHDIMDELPEICRDVVEHAACYRFTRMYHIFSRLADDIVLELSISVRRMPVHVGEIIIREGQPAPGLPRRFGRNNVIRG